MRPLSAMLPPYTVNETLVRDIQADSVSQISQQLAKRQAAAYYMHDCQQSRLDLGPLSGFVRPPVTLVLTPLGFAVLFDSLRVARYLLAQAGASPADRAYLADRPAAGGKARVVELPTAGLALPGRDMFSLLSAYGLDPSAHLPLRLRCCGGGCGAPADELLPGFWHLLWRCWSPMRDCDALIQTTDLLLRTGADANSGLAGMPVMREAFFFDGQQFEDRATALKAARYLRLLLLAGCRPDRLGRPSDIAGVLLAVWRSLHRPTAAEAATAAAAAAAVASTSASSTTPAPTHVNPADEEAEAMCFDLTDCLMGCWPALAARLLLPHHLQRCQLHHLLPLELALRHTCRQPPSLRVSAALAVRSGLGGRHFLRRLCCLPQARLDRNLRLLVRWPTAPAPRLPPPPSSGTSKAWLSRPRQPQQQLDGGASGGAGVGKNDEAGV